MDTCGYPEYGLLSPLATKKALEILDSRIEQLLNAGDAYAVLSIRDKRLGRLFPELSRERLALALSVYADLARDRWHVEHFNNHSKYYFSPYSPGQPQDMHTRVEPSDFIKVRAYLEKQLKANVFTLLCRESLEYAGISLKTRARWTWLMLHAFFSLVDEFIVTGKKHRYGRKPLSGWILTVTSRRRMEKPFAFYGMQCVWNDSLVCVEEKGCKACVVPPIALREHTMAKKKRVDKNKRPSATPPIKVSDGVSPGRMRLSESAIFGTLAGSPRGLSIQDIERKCGYSYSTVRVAIRRLVRRGLISICITPGFKSCMYRSTPDIAPAEKPGAVG
jgi:predicted DNA-binding transcriptional regulator